MKLDVDVTGLDDVVKKLRAVDQKVSIKTTRAALKFAAKPAIEKAKQLVKYDTSADGDGYHLRDTISLRLETKRNRGGNATSMRFGAHRQTLPAGDPSGYRIAGGLGKGIKAPNYAQLVNKQKPFLEPAIEQTMPLILQRFGSKITALVSKL